jgi:hypothetical protein
LTEEQTVVVRLDMISRAELDLFLLDSEERTGSPGNCIAMSATFPFFGFIEFEEIAISLDAGIDWIVVDGNGSSSSDISDEGLFQLTLNCFPKENITTIACGETITGSTIGRPSQFEEADFAACSSIDGDNGGTHGDRLYRFELMEAQSVSIKLEIKSNAKLNLYLLRSSFDFGSQNFIPGDCLAKSEQLYAFEEILINLDKGVYWIVVDGQDIFTIGGVSVTSEGVYHLSVDCFDLPTVCEAEGQLFSNGTIFSQTSRAIPRSHLEFTHCISEVYSDIPDYGQIYIFYHEDDGQFFSIDINREDPSINAFVFDCQKPREASCLGTTAGKEIPSITIENAPAGFYYILVLGNVFDAPFELNLFPTRGPCSSESITKAPRDPSTFSLSGFGNDLNIDNYQGCIANPDERSYDGEDRIFVLDISQTFEFGPSEEIDIFWAITLEASSGLGLYVVKIGSIFKNCPMKEGKPTWQSLLNKKVFIILW